MNEQDAYFSFWDTLNIEDNNFAIGAAKGAAFYEFEAAFPAHLFVIAGGEQEILWFFAA